MFAGQNRTHKIYDPTDVFCIFERRSRAASSLQKFTFEFLRPQCRPVSLLCISSKTPTSFFLPIICLLALVYVSFFPLFRSSLTLCARSFLRYGEPVTWNEISPGKNENYRTFNYFRYKIRIWIFYLLLRFTGYNVWASSNDRFPYLKIDRRVHGVNIVKNFRIYLNYYTDVCKQLQRIYE